MDTSTPAGTWYLLANASRLELSIQFQNNTYSGTIRNEGGAAEPLDQIVWDPVGRWLEFRRHGAAFFQWYRICITYGVMAGRFLRRRPRQSQRSPHIHITSRVGARLGLIRTSCRTWTLTINQTYTAVLRIDRDAGNVLRGRLRVFANTAIAGPQEELENDLTSITWDGTNLSFIRSAGFTQVYKGTASGRFLRGTFTHNGGAPAPWSGTRAEVLGFGLGSRLPTRDVWQAETRARVVNLTEGMRLVDVGIPPISVQNQGPAGPFLGGYPPERDDDPNAWAPNYTIKKLTFSVPPNSRFDPVHPPPPRVFSGYLATPKGPVPEAGSAPLSPSTATTEARSR